MTLIKSELFDEFYSVFPTNANLYLGDTEMPNHCHNRVTFYSDNTEEVAKLKKIFEDESIFGQIIPEPDWPNTPLMSKDVQGLIHDRGNLGELPVKLIDPWERYVFQSTGRSDDRWYDWRIQNWDTKWDAYDVQVDGGYDDDEITVEFNTAWSPPEAVCNALREQYPEATVSWFYDEPGCELAGYL